MGAFGNWLGGMNVLYAGEANAPHHQWLTSAGANVTVLSTAESLTEALDKKAQRFDLAVVDAEWPAIGWVRLARDLADVCGVLVLSEQSDAGMLERVCALRATFLSKQATEGDFMFTLRSASQLAVPNVRRLASYATKLWSLPRQLSRLLYFNLWSYSDQEIADAMGLSRHTVQEYQDELRRRTGVRTKHAYLRRLLEYAGEEPPLSMTDETRAHVTRYRRERQSAPPQTLAP